MREPRHVDSLDTLERSDVLDEGFAMFGQPFNGGVILDLSLSVCLKFLPEREVSGLKWASHGKGRTAVPQSGGRSREKN